MPAWLVITIGVAALIIPVFWLLVAAFKDTMMSIYKRDYH